MKTLTDILIMRHESILLALAGIMLMASGTLWYGNIVPMIIEHVTGAICILIAAIIPPMDLDEEAEENDEWE